MLDEPPILAENVSKSFRCGDGALQVLDRVNLVVHPGECVFLVGPSGSGKSTLLSILACLLTPDRGTVRILGSDVTKLTSHDLARLRRDRVGFVFQRFQLIRGLNAWQNVSLPLTLRGESPWGAQRRAVELLHDVGLADKVHGRPETMSSGQCQRIALARALAGNPELVFADEPTASLDAHNGQQVMQLLRKLTSEQGKSALVVTHDPRILQFADRVLYLKAGRLEDIEARTEDALLVPGG